MAVIDIKENKSPIHGTAGKDEINLKAPVGNGIVIYGDAGNDIITVTRGDEHRIYAGEGADFVTVSSGKKYLIDLGTGNDRVDVYGASGHRLVASSGDNTFNINSGSGYLIESGPGNDRLMLKGNNSNTTAYLGEGADVLCMATGSGNELHGGAGNDTIVVTGESSLGVMAGLGKDNVYIASTTGVQLMMQEQDHVWIDWDKIGSKCYLTNENSSSLALKDRNQLLLYSKTLKLLEAEIYIDKGNQRVVISNGDRNIVFYHMDNTYMEHIYFQSEAGNRRNVADCFNLRKAYEELSTGLYSLELEGYYEGTCSVDNPFVKDYMPEAIKASLNS